MNPSPSAPSESEPGGRKPGAGATSDSNSGVEPRKKQVTPWDETVKYTPPPSGPRPSSEPAIPGEAAAMAPTARFGKFIRTQRLGAGGMGEVWKAWDTVLGRWVALKFLKGGDDEEIARFRREAQTAGRLHHPNIAAIYEVDEDQGRHYIAMQYVDGRTLHAFPRADRKSLVELMADAAEAVQYAHQQGVVHRDLKPENLMVASRVKADGKSLEHHVYVMDFGLARATEGASNFSVTGLVVGTPSYMPPEQARGERVDARADVYALGAALYELLTAQKPFEGPNVYETLRKVQEAEPRAPRKIDPKIATDLATIVLKCLSKEPEGRYRTAQALAEDLRAFNAGESILARPEGASRRLWRKVRRHPIVSLAAVVLVMGLGVSSLVFARASRERKFTTLAQGVNDLLAPAEWTEDQLRRAEAVIAELAALAPDEGIKARTRLREALARSVRESMRTGDLRRARSTLELMASRNMREAGPLREELRERESIWPSVLKLEPPFGDPAGVFEKGRVRAESGVLRREAGSGPEALTRTASAGNVEFRAEFDSAWKEASEVGLVLNAGRPGAYQFLVLIPEAQGLKDQPPPPPSSFESVRQTGGSIRMVIKRGDSLLRQLSIPAAEVFSRADGSLLLLARRERDRITFQMNGRPPLELGDPFAFAGAQAGVFGLDWPPGVGLRRLLAYRQDLPTVPGPLQLGDDLFVQAKYEEALERYREAALAAVALEVRQEARYKEGLCHLHCNRDETAWPIFEEVAARFLEAPAGSETRWPFLADCQLLLHYFRQKDGIEKAAAILEKMSGYQYSFEKLALLIPQEVHRDILENTFIGGAGANMARRPEDQVARQEFAVKASDLLEPPGKRPHGKRHGLLRAYMLAGRDGDALRTAEKMFRDYGFGGDALDDYCWILRLAGETRRALDAVDRAIASDPAHLVERARIHGALKEWDLARQDLEEFFRKPTVYFHASAAWLLEGFLREQRGEPGVRVEEAWRRGLSKNWKAAVPGKGQDVYRPGHVPEGTPMLHNWIMASLTGDMTDADAEQLLSGLMVFAGRENPVFFKLMRPSVLRATWRTPRARALARRVALRDLPFSDYARYPLYVGWIAFLHEVCFPPGPLSAEDDELLWRFAKDIYAAMMEGLLNERYFLPFGTIVQGNPNYPGMGWKEISAMLERAPRLRGTLAYVFGQRYAKKGDAANALMFFRSALSDASREPAYPLLRKLAAPEVERLKGP